MVASVRQGWARQNPRRVEAYIRATSDAVDWLYQPENKDEAIRIFLSNMPPGTSASSAETAYRVLLDSKYGFHRKGRLNMDGIARVAQLRSKFGAKGAAIKPAVAYVDHSYLDGAIGGRR